MDIYTQAKMPAKRDVQRKVVEIMRPEVVEKVALAA